jgi:hypothetical protein
MIKLEIDFREVEHAALSVGAAADQIPYAMTLALNRAADVTRNFLIKATWPQHVQQRNNSFIAASLTTRDARAQKTSLSVELYDKLDRGNLQMHAKGGTRTPMGGAALAVPSSQLPKTSRGIPQRLRPKTLGSNAVRKGDVLYQRDNRGRLRLLYVLKPQTKVPKQVPFYEDYERSMRAELQRLIPLAVKQAMSTRR